MFRWRGCSRGDANTARCAGPSHAMGKATPTMTSMHRGVPTYPHPRLCFFCATNATIWGGARKANRGKDLGGVNNKPFFFFFFTKQGGNCKKNAKFSEKLRKIEINFRHHGGGDSNIAGGVPQPGHLARANKKKSKVNVAGHY